MHQPPPKTSPPVPLQRIEDHLLALKFLFHIHFGLFGVGFWAAVVLTAGLIVLAMQARRGESLMPSRQAAVDAESRFSPGRR